ncbi:MAG: hypothetical protein AAGB31_07775 [Bdellovibrio sp.]
MEKKIKNPRKKTETSVKSGQDSVASIIEAFIDICAVSGNEKVTLKALSERTGLSLSNVKYHIDNSPKSLEELCTEFTRNHVNMYLEESIFKDRMSGHFDPLLSYAKHMLTWTFKYPRLGVYLLMIYYKSALQESTTSRYESILTRALSRVESLLHEGVGMGLYQTEGVNKKDIIVSFHALILGHLVITVNMRSQEELESRLKMSQEFLQTQLIVQKNKIG